MRRPLLLLVLLLCARSTPSDRVLPQDVYIWQRVWTPALAASINDSAGLVSAFRLLVAEWSPDGRIVRAGIDWALLAEVDRPVVAVLRIDYRHALPSPQAVATEIPVGHPLAGVEIDFDCPTGRLPEYRRFLMALRPLLPAGSRLSITALPDWLRSPAFTALTRVVDQPVLQVHATDDPRDGLFDQDRMMAAVRLMSHLSARPFVVSLPSYGVRVVLAPDGTVRGTEAERGALLGQNGRELFVRPERMARALAALEHDPPFPLAGVVWFRLPVEGDRRAWGLGSWRAVLSRKPSVAVPVLVRRAGKPVLLRLENRSELDAVLPDRITLDAGCAAADGAGPYRREGTLLVSNGAGMMPARSTLLVGWERCGS